MQSSEHFFLSRAIIIHALDFEYSNSKYSCPKVPCGLIRIRKKWLVLFLILNIGLFIGTICVTSILTENSLLCTPEYNTSYYGENHFHKNITTWEECGHKCNFDPECKVWTWMPSQFFCNLILKKRDVSHDVRFISGSRTCFRPK